MKYISLAICLFGLSGCFTTSLHAPDNTQVRIMSEKDKATYHNEYKDWYLFAGTIPIRRQDISELIAKEKLAEVRVRTEDRVSDGVITLITEIIFPVFPQTIVVEGNTAEQVKKLTKAPAASSSGK